MEHERDAGIAQRIEADADREHGGAVERGDEILRDAVLVGDVEPAGTPGQLHDVGGAVDRLEPAAAGLGLDEAGDVLVDDRVAVAHGDRVDERLPVQQDADVVVAEHVLAPGEGQARAGDDHGLAAGAVDGGGGPGGSALQESGALRERVGEHVPQAGVQVVSGGRGGGAGSRGNHDDGRTRISGGQRGRGRRLSRPPCRTETGGVEAGECLVERHDIPLLRMVGEQDRDLGVVTEHVLGHAVEGALGTDLDEHPAARVVQRAQAGDELDRRGDLAAQQVDHRGGGIGAGGVEASRDVAHERDRRRLQVQPGEDRLERLGRGGDDLGVEGVAHRELDDLAPQGGELRHGRLHTGRRAADHRLRGGVEVGDDHVVGDLVEHRLHLVERSEDRGHQAVVAHRHGRHLVPARRHRLQRVVEGHRPGGHECRVLAEAVAHHHVRSDAVGLEQAGEGEIGGEHGRLGDLGLP